MVVVVGGGVGGVCVYGGGGGIACLLLYIDFLPLLNASILSHTLPINVVYTRTCHLNITLSQVSNLYSK